MTEQEKLIGEQLSEEEIDKLLVLPPERIFKIL